jgi:phenylalanyl-tRNA synthetase beta chain
VLGVVGEYKKEVSRSFKLPEYTAGFEVDIDVLFKIAKGTGVDYSPIIRFPSTDRDVCFQVSSELAYGNIIEALSESTKSIDLDVSITPIDIYQSEGSNTKNITVRIRLTPHNRTLTSEEASSATKVLVKSVLDKVDAKVV